MPSRTELRRRSERLPRAGLRRRSDRPPRTGLTGSTRPTGYMAVMMGFESSVGGGGGRRNQPPSPAMGNLFK